MRARLTWLALLSIAVVPACRKAEAPALPAFPLEGPWPTLEDYCRTQAGLQMPDGGVPCGTAHDQAPAVEVRTGTGVRLQGAGFARRLARMARGDVNSEVVVWVKTPRGVWLEPLGHVRREDPRALQEVTVQSAAVPADDANRLGFRYSKKLETRTQNDLDTFSEVVTVGEDGRAWSVRLKESVRANKKGESAPEVRFGPGAQVTLRTDGFIPESRARVDAGTYVFEAPR